MRILHTGDWHIGKTLDGFSRIKEQEMFLDFFVEQSQNINPDIIIIAGDVFDTSNPSAVAETLFYSTLTRLSDVTNALIVVIAGNHDSPKRLSSSRTLARIHGIIIYENHDDGIETGHYKNAKVLSCNQGVVKVQINDKIANIMCIPYISEARLNESIQDLSKSDEENAKSFQKKFESLVNKKVEFFDENQYNIMIAHLFTINTTVSDEDTGYSLGGAYVLNASALPKSADYIALGHIHKKLCVSGVDKKAWYSGSPIHYNKTETKIEAKTILQIDISEDKNLQIQEIPIPIYKKIEIWEAGSIEQAILMSEEKSQEDSFVYINVKTDRIITNEEMITIRKNKDDVVEICPIMTNQDMIYETTNMLEKNDEEKFVQFYKEKYKLNPPQNILDRYMDILKQED